MRWWLMSNCCDIACPSSRQRLFFAEMSNVPFTWMPEPRNVHTFSKDQSLLGQIVASWGHCLNRVRFLIWTKWSEKVEIYLISHISYLISQLQKMLHHKDCLKLWFRGSFAFLPFFQIVITNFWREKKRKLFKLCWNKHNYVPGLEGNLWSSLN